MKSVWPKKCSVCETEYSADEWESLYYTGVMKSTKLGFPNDLEHRMCGRCGNDLAQPTVGVDEVIEVKR